jgi:hypothetical protein
MIDLFIFSVRFRSFRLKFIDKSSHEFIFEIKLLRLLMISDY